MALTRREHIIMILAGAAVVILISDRIVLSPLLEKRSQTRQTRETLETEFQQAQAALARQDILQERWTQMQRAGLTDRTEIIERLLFRLLEESSANSGLLLTSIQPDRQTNQPPLGEIELLVSGTGSLAAVTAFLWDIETAQIPLMIKSLQLGAKDENASQVSLQVKLSSIFLLKQEDAKL